MIIDVHIFYYMYTLICLHIDIRVPLILFLFFNFFNMVLICWLVGLWDGSNDKPDEATDKVLPGIGITG